MPPISGAKPRRHETASRACFLRPLIKQAQSRRWTCIAPEYLATLREDGVPVSFVDQTKLWTRLSDHLKDVVNFVHYSWALFVKNARGRAFEQLPATCTKASRNGRVPYSPVPNFHVEPFPGQTEIPRPRHSVPLCVGRGWRRVWKLEMHCRLSPGKGDRGCGQEGFAFI